MVSAGCAQKRGSAARLTQGLHGEPGCWLRVQAAAGGKRRQRLAAPSCDRPNESCSSWRALAKRTCTGLSVMPRASQPNFWAMCLLLPPMPQPTSTICSGGLEGRQKGAVAAHDIGAFGWGISHGRLAAS